MMRKTIDLNCDVGEGLGNEHQLMPYISSCSIACGGHAGDDVTMVDTIKLALRHNVKIGAHPSFPDTANFGRKVMHMDAVALQRSIENQIEHLKGHIDVLGATLCHVKAHGALYNLSALDRDTAQILIAAVKSSTDNVPLYVPYNSLLANIAKENDLPIMVEAFGDRNYNTDLSLVSRKLKNAVLIDEQLVLDHLMHMIKDNEVISVDGVGVKIEAETFCIHGDNPRAIQVIEYVSKELQKKNIQIV